MAVPKGDLYGRLLHIVPVNSIPGTVQLYCRSAASAHQRARGLGFRNTYPHVAVAQNRRGTFLRPLQFQPFSGRLGHGIDLRAMHTRRSREFHVPVQVLTTQLKYVVCVCTCITGSSGAPCARWSRRANSRASATEECRCISYLFTRISLFLQVLS